MDLVNNNNVSILSIIINVPQWYKVLIIEETWEGGKVKKYIGTLHFTLNPSVNLKLL